VGGTVRRGRFPVESLDLTRDCHSTYLQAADQTRRLFNQAFFTRIYIDQDDETRQQSVRVDYNQPFGGLLSRLIPAGAHHDLDTKQPPTGKRRWAEPPISLAASWGSRVLMRAVLVVLTGLSSKQLRMLANTLGAVPVVRTDRVRPGQTPSRARRLQPEEIVALLLAYRQGTSMAALAKQFNVRRQTVSDLLQRSAIPIRERRAPSSEEIAEAVRLYHAGWSLARVGSHLSFDHETVRRHLKLQGVQMRPPWERHYPG
jgi:transposase